MTLALTNLDLLHRGWEDAVSDITSHLPEVRATMETEFAALQHEDRIDEQALLAAVREVAAVAARAAGADKARLLSRSMHRSVYEYLLSLDALAAEEAEGDTPANGAVTDPSRLIGMEEVAELEGRQAALQAEAEAAAAAIAAAEQAAAEREAEERAAAERAAAEAQAAAERAAAEAQAAAERAAAEARAAEERAAGERAAAEQAAAARAASHRAAAERAAAERLAAEQDAAERAAAYRASLDQPETHLGAETNVLAGLQAALDEAVDPDSEDETGGGHYRPRFKIFRRGVPEVPRATHPGTDAGGAEDSPGSPGTPEWWRGPDAPPAPEPSGTPAEPAAPAAPMEPAAAAKRASWVDQIAPPEPAAADAAPAEPVAAEPVAAEPATNAPAADGGFAVAPRDGFHLTEFADFVRPEPASEPEPVAQVQAEPAPSSNGDGKPRGWHIRSSNRPRTGEPAEAEVDALGPELDEDAWEERRLIEQDPKISDARGEINELLRKRRCDDAASLLQKLATDSGGRSVAELALDAGDRCRALGKGNAALSCYIAASRADPSFEGPLMRLADVCLDDRDIDLAVTYLERVARLHRQRGDTRGALRLYRKIATIAPYRDDILATLMRANTTGQFED